MIHSQNLFHRILYPIVWQTDHIDLHDVLETHEMILNKAFKIPTFALIVLLVMRQLCTMKLNYHLSTTRMANWRAGKTA